MFIAVLVVLGVLAGVVGLLVRVGTRQKSYAGRVRRGRGGSGGDAGGGAGTSWYARDETGNVSCGSGGSGGGGGHSGGHSCGGGSSCGGGGGCGGGS